MTEVVYEIVEHDGGWAYRYKGSLSETFLSHEEARLAAVNAALEHEQPGHSEEIEYEDSNSKWHREHASGRDRPSTRVVDQDDPNK